MSKFPLVPLSEAFKMLIAETMHVTPEEACQLEIYRQFFEVNMITLDADEVEKEDKAIEVEGIKVDISIVRPLGQKDKTLPVILFLHGGGWSACSYKTHSILVSKLVTLANACIVFVHYSLSPEAKYPVALKECYAALCWIQQNAEKIGVDTNKLAVMGDSSGGNLSAALTSWVPMELINPIVVYAKQKGNRGIKQQVLYYPPLGTTFDSETFKLYENDEFLPRELVIYFVNNYVRSQEDYLLPCVAPLRASLETLAGLASALIITDEHDVLRSDGEEYAHKLLKAGVPVISVRYQNTSHSFLLPTNPKISPEARVGITQTVDWLKSQWKED